jgi:hypothetical protein
VYLLEKSPGNILLTRFLQAMFPNAYFIIMTRHPIAVSLATREWFWFYQIKRYRIDQLVKNWVVAHEHFRQDQPYLEQVITINYENFVQQPDSVLASVYDFLHIKKYAHQHIIKPGINSEYFQQWRILECTLWSRPFIEFTKRYYGARVEKLGYNLDIVATD